MLRRIQDETRIERLRVSSLEPMDVTEDLIGLFAASDRLAQHFHMPMQSGSDRILKAMRRWYRAEHYQLARWNWFANGSPDAAIGADVMVGFSPGRNREKITRATHALIERMPLTYLHVFSVFLRAREPRRRKCRDRISSAVAESALRELRALGKEKEICVELAQAGRTMRVLTLNRGGEDASGAWTRALSGNYLDVRLVGRRAANEFVDFQVTGVRDTHLVGELI